MSHLKQVVSGKAILFRTKRFIKKFIDLVKLSYEPGIA